MLVLLSPAKTIKPEPCPWPELSTTKSAGMQQAQTIMSQLKLWSLERLRSEMKLSDKLASTVLEWHRQWRLDSKNAAGMCFHGDAFKSLDLGSLDEMEFNKAQQNLRILHGVYGLLRPLDGYAPVRLEMAQSWSPDAKHKTMSSYWKPQLPDLIRQEMTRGNHAWILNLASAEYGNVALGGLHEWPVVECEFLEIKAGKPKNISSFSKTARGAMARYAIQQNVQSAEDLKAFNNLGYALDKTASSKLKLVFTRTSRT